MLRLACLKRKSQVKLPIANLHSKLLRIATSHCETFRNLQARGCTSPPHLYTERKLFKMSNEKLAVALCSPIIYSGGWPVDRCNQDYGLHYSIGQWGSRHGELHKDIMHHLLINKGGPYPPLCKLLIQRRKGGTPLEGPPPPL